MKKSNIILISIIVIILIIVVLGGCIIYFGTDLLKTDKQLFMKYASQMLEGNSEGNKVLEYMDKKQQNSYISSGKITANNSSSDEEYQELLDIGNEVSISFEKQKDIINNEEKLDINLNYSENVKFPIELVRSEDTIGIKSEEVVNKYVAFENNNLKAFCQKLGMTDVSDIPDKIDLEKIESTKYENIFTEQEIESLNERYGQVIDKYITNENFSKEENGTEVAYVLEITKDQFYNIIEACLTELKTDNILLQKIADIQEKNIDDIEAEISDGIDELINNIEENKDENIDGDNIKISVYQTNGKATRIEIGYSNFKISIKREQNEDKEKLEISVNMAEDDTEDSYSTSSGTNEMVALISIEYTGLSDMTNVSNIIEVSMTINSDDDEMEFNYKLENEVEFVDNVSIDDITEYNAIVLNEYDSEVISNLLEVVGEKIVEVNNQKIEELGISQNPFLYTNPVTISIAQFSELELSSEEDYSMNEIGKEEFNAIFEKYEGTQKGTTIKKLKEEMEESNGEVGNSRNVVDRTP